MISRGPGLHHRGLLAALREDQSGQVLFLFTLMLFTLLSFTALVISVGQILARKALAQKMADIGALAGASEQASALNYISYIHAVELKFLRETAYITRVAPFDLDTTDDSTIKGFLEIEQVSVFDPLTGGTEVKLAEAPGDARTLAENVTRENIGTLFPLENPVDFAYRNPEYDLDPSKQAQLFQPTSPHVRNVYWGYYTTISPCPNPFTCASWIAECARYYAYLATGPDSFPFTTYFTRADPQKEIHFYWEVTIPETPAMMGIFGKLPKVTATAKAKPYGGQSGDPPSDDTITDPYYYVIPDCTCIAGEINNTWDDWHTYKVDHDFSATFKAKLDAFTDTSNTDAAYLSDLKTRFGDLGEVRH